jgi:methionyl-tRNA synthetase|tara:strand:+ start:1943 stop:3487 length:1545 start_codon:yes stop_codon:yes gene_type:complete
MSDNNFYITTPIYYPSGNPHMGHAYSSIIADVFARFKRLEGKNVYFLTGTDEHGLKIQREAEKNNKETKIFCDEISFKFKNLAKTLNLSINDFIRTTEQRHHESVKAIWNKLVESGDIYISKYSGWYSVSDEAYYTEDEILTKDGKKVSISSGSSVDWFEEESFFFKLSSWQNKLLDHYKKNPDFISPKSRNNEITQFVKSGLNDLSVSRTSFKWGVKVPNNDKHIVYVWLDALTNYISALNFPDTNDKLYKDFWPANLHIIGKDILRFHTVYWPAFLMAAKLPLPLKVYGHGWILSDDKKMSKSIGNILDPLEIIDKYGIDQLRYYLVKEVSLGNDGNISMENLKNCINNDLANNFGNLCQRVFSFIERNCAGKLPTPTKFEEVDLDLINNLINKTDELIVDINKQELNNYVKKVIEFSFNANKYFNDLEPWALKKTNVERMNTILYSIVTQIKNISILLSPIIPISSNKILNIMNIKKEDRLLESIINKNVFNHNLEFKKTSILFKKIENDS